MRTRARTLLLSAGALAVAGALGLYAYFGVLRSEEKAAAEKEAKEKLVAPVPETDGGAAGAWGRLQGHLVRYDKLVLTARGETTELGRLPDSAWVISRPFRARADAHVAEDAVSTLQALRLSRIVDEQPKDEDLERYGLKPPRFVVTASAEGTPSVTLFGGVENSYDGTLYVQRDGKRASMPSTLPAALPWKKGPRSCGPATSLAPATSAWWAFS